MSTKVIKTKSKSKPLPNNKTLVTFKMDKELKKQIETLAGEINLTLSAMLNSLIKDVVRKQKFEIDLGRVTVNSIEELEEKVLEGFNSRAVSLENSFFYKRLKEAKGRK